MIKERQDTIEDIVAEMLRDCHQMHLDGTRCLDGDWVYTKGSVERLAVRIEVVYKREVDELRRLLKVAEKALKNLQERLVSSVYDGKIDPHEALEIAENALSAILEEGGEMNSKKSVTNCNRFGNAAKMREALLNVKGLFDGRIMFQKAVREAHEVVNAALATPPRNCDVGTPEEQHNRFMRFCDSKSMGYCWGRGCRKCMAQWGQLPYEEGGAK